MLSGLDLLKGTKAKSAKTGLDLLQGIAPIEGEMQVKTGLDLLRQSVVTEAPTTAAPVMPDIHPAAAYLEKFTKPPTGEFEAAKYQMAPLITAENTAPAMDTLGRLWNLAQHPYDVVKGATVFASEIPGFVGGLASAIGQVPIEILKGGTVLDWYNASARNMQTISSLWHRGVSAPLGKLLETPEKMGEELAQTMFGAEPKPHKTEAEMVGEIFMVPYTASSAPLHAMANSPTWDDHPNIRGLLKFTADALGLVTMGLVLKGGPVMASRRAEPIIKRAHDIDTREKAIDASGLDEIIKTAQKKVLDAEKTQLELEIESLKKDIDHEKLVKEDLKEKGIEVEKAKKGIEVETEAIREERLRFAEERAKEPSLFNIKLQSVLKEKLAIGREMEARHPGILEEMQKDSRKDPLVHSPSLRRELSEEGTRLGYHDLIYVERKSEAGFVKGRKDIQEITLPKEYVELTTSELAEAVGYKSFNEIPKEKIPELAKEAFALGVDLIEGGSQWRVVNPKYVKRAKEIPEKKVKTGLKLIKKMPPKPVEVFDTSTTGISHWDDLLSKGEAEVVRMSPDEYMSEVLDIQGLTMEETMRAIPEDLPSEYAKRMKEGEKAPTPILDYVEGAQEGRARALAAKQLGIEEIPVVVRERPTTDLDLQTGTKEPPALSTESSPFRETPERTQAMKDVYAERAEAVRSNPELMTNKLLNDVNRWLDGEELPVEKAKNDLSELAARAEELERSFISRSDFLRWKDTVSSAATWARKADRTKIERPLPSVDLNIMIPLDQIPMAVLEAFRGIKDLRIRDAYRNEKIFSETGFWLGRDHFWRYEIDDSKVKIRPKESWTWKDKFGTYAKKEATLYDIIDYPELFEAVPELKNIRVEYGPHLPTYPGGPIAEYNSARKAMTFYRFPDKSDILHETQHAVNEEMGAFRGASLEIAGRKAYRETPGEMEARLTEARRDMSLEERTEIPPWETLDDMLRAEGLPRKVGPTLYTGLPVDEVVKLIKYIKNRLIKSYLPDESMSTSGYIFDNGKTVNLTKKTKYGYDSITHIGALLEGLSEFDLEVTKNILGTTEIEFLSQFLSISNTIRYVRGADDVLFLEMYKRPTNKQLDIIKSNVDAEGIIHLDLFSKSLDIKGRDLERTINKHFDKDIKLYSGLPIDEAVKGLIKATKKGLTIYKELDLARFEKFRGYFRSLPLSKRLDLLASGKLKPVTADVTESLSMKLQDIRKEFAIDPKKLVKNTDLYRKLVEETITDAETDTWLALTTKQRLNAGYLYDMAKDSDKLIDNMSVGVVLKDLPPGEVSIKLYSGLPIDEAVKQLKSMAKHTAEFMKEFKGSFKEKEFDFDHAVKQVKADTLRSLWDQSETLLNIVKNKYPKEYDRVVSRQRSAVTGIGYGKILYGRAVKEIYGGMSKEMVNAINAYILARRFKDIYGYREEKGYKHQPGYGAKQSITTSTMIEMIKDIPPDAWKDLASKVPEIEVLFGKLTPEEMASVVKAGDAYFEWSRKIIDDLVEIGIKSPEEGALLKAHDFRKFKTMLIKKLYDFNYDLQLKGETIKVSNSGVLELGSGSSKILEPDSRVVLSEQMARAYGSIAHQAAALEWKGLADRHPDNGFVSMKKQAGWSPIPYMADGVRKNIYFHPDAVKYLVTRSRDISPRLAIAIRGLTLAPVTRALAVGLSPIWSTFAGLPMDIMHSLWAARTWEADAKGVRPKASFPFYKTREGKFRKVYSPFAGVDALQIGLDMKRTFKDVYSRGPLTENLMKHGLVMNFLTQRMNRYMKGVKPPGDWAKTMDILSYHGLSMELLARVATADRVIRRDAKKLGITYEQALKNDDIMYRAAHAGRDRMDYNQGGWFVKALDQSGMIFLNAAVLGTRTFWRQAVDNPVDFTFRTAQLGITAAGLTAAAWSLYPEVMKDQSASANKRDVTWPIAPDWLKVKDIDGNDVTFHFKLRMDPNAAFLYRVFEGLTKTYMYDQGLTLEEPDYRELVETLKHLGPVDVKLPPAIQASVDYVTNYSWWKDRHMYTELGGKTFDWPQSQYEGMFDPRVPQMAKDVAGVTKLSPKRLAGTVSNVIPSNNEFVWLMNGAYEQAFSDLPEEVRRQHWLITLAETPGFNKVIGMTRHGQGRWKVKSDIENEVELKRMVMNSKFDMLATQNAWYGVRNKEKLFKFMKEQEFDDYNRMVDIFKFIKDPVVKSLPHRDFWLSMRHSSIEGRAKTWVELLDRASEDEKKQLMDELGQVMVVGGVVTPEFMEEVEKVRSQ